MSEQTNDPIYKQLSNEMREGLRDIYQEISSASRQGGEEQQTEARALFQEATAQLQEVLQSTEEAATNILEIVERNEMNQEETARILAEIRENGASPAKIARLEAMNQTLGDDLMSLTLQLSFQDLTGQRIKRVVSALNKIENTVVNLYVKSGLVMEGAESDPGKDVELLNEEAEKAMEEFRNHRVKHSELKGPDKEGASQSVIDDMLAQLGM